MKSKSRIITIRDNRRGKKSRNVNLLSWMTSRTHKFVKKTAVAFFIFYLADVLAFIILDGSLVRLSFCLPVLICAYLL